MLVTVNPEPLSADFAFHLFAPEPTNRPVHAPAQSPLNMRVGFMSDASVGGLRGMTENDSITMSEGRLSVPEHPVVHFIEGDGIGIGDADFKAFSL